MYQFIRKVFLFVLLAELLSLFSFLLPPFMPYTFWTIVALFFIICLYKLEWGFYILLTELFIGSKGYLFFFEHSGIAVSVRIAFFIIFLSVWLALKLTKPKLTLSWLKETYLKNKSLISSFLFLISIIAWGIIWGLIRSNNFDNLFFDFNGWLYFALFLPFLNLINPARIKKVIALLITCVTWTALKTFAALFIFSHQFFNVRPFYKWLRDSGVGEITVMDGGFSRIFFQSQIYVLIAFFIITTIIVYKIINKNNNRTIEQPVPRSFSEGGSNNRTPHYNTINFIILILLLSTLITSLSRSYWVGLFAGLIILLTVLIIQKINFKTILKLSGGLLISLIVSLALIFAVVKVPPTTADLYGSLFTDRLSQVDVAGSSRVSQLKPLLTKITKHPVVGSGFGTTVTYQSQDPRIKTDLNPQGWYTTYAFEWGYLDILLKLGLVGLLIYLYFIYLIIKKGISIIYHPSSIFIQKELVLGLLLGTAALLTTNIFSPYLNHPLGIGYIILCGTIFIALKSEVDYSGD